MKAPSMTMIPSEKKVPNTYAKEMKEPTHVIDPRPQFSINADLLPAIKDWKTGQKYKLEIEVEQTGSRIETYGDDKGKLVGEFRISGVMVDNDTDEAKEEPKGSFPKGMTVKNKK